MFNASILTKVELFKTFFRAEGYHKDYFKHHSEQAYCRLFFAPKVAKLKKLEQNEATNLMSVPSVRKPPF